MSAKINPFTVRSGSGANYNNYRIPTLPSISHNVKLALNIAFNIAALLAVTMLILIGFIRLI